MKKTGIFFGALGVFMVIALVVGTAGAATITPNALVVKSTKNETGSMPGPGLPGDLIAHLKQQGVDVSGLETAIQNGDTAAVKAWLDAHRGPDHMNQTDNGACPDPGKLLTLLKQQGVDVSGLETAIQNGDTAAITAWLDAHRGPDHMNQTGNGACPDPGKLLTFLKQQGVDVSGLETAIQNGDSAAIKAWFDAHPGPDHMNQTDNGNIPETGKLVTSLRQQGDTVSVAETTSQNSDTNIVKTWLDDIRRIT